MITEDRTAAPFTRVSVSDALAATITLGDVTSVQVTGDSDLLRDVITRVANDELIIEFRDGSVLWDRSRLQLTVMTPELNALTVSGAADADLSVAAEDFTIDASGSSTVTARGHVQRGTFNAEGTSDLYLSGLQVVDVTAVGSGNTGLELCVSGALVLRLGGASHAYYGCNPVSVSREVTGSSSASAW